MKVTGFGKVTGLLVNFSLRKKFGKHGECKFTMSVKDDEATAQLEKVGKSIGVSIVSENPLPVFFGEIKSITLNRKISKTCIEVFAVSDSKKIDEEKHTRVFQNPEKTFADVLNISRLKLQNCELSLSSETAKTKYKNIILQNQETDFEFINRLSKYSGSKLWINDTKQGKIVLKVGDVFDETPRKIEFKKLLSCSIGREKKFKTASFVTREYFPLGSLVQIENDSCKYLITSLELKLIHGADRFFYETEEYSPKKIKIEPVPLEKTVKLKAQILKNKDEKNLGRVQVQVVNVEDEDKEKIWLPYRTPYGGKEGGIVFLPDEKDFVELIYTNGEFFVCSAVRENPLQKECHNVNDKYIGNNFEQRIFLKEKSLEIMSVKNKIYLDKNKIELAVGENKILLDENGIVLQTPKNKISMNDNGIEINSDKNFSLEAGGEAKIFANKSSTFLGKSVTVQAESGEVNISASKIVFSS